MDLGTCGCVDHRQNVGPQSVESINTSAAHILARVNLKLGRVLTTTSQEPGTAWELTMPHGWLKSERRSYGVWDTGCYCNACQLPGIAASFSMGNRLLAQLLPRLLPINKTAHVHTRSQDASFVLQYACATRIQGSGTLCRRQRR